MYSIDSYSFNQHRHNYAIWTAARAVQRNFTSTFNIKYAIEQSGLREFAESDNVITIDDFNSFHRTCAKKIETAFLEKGVNKCSYGRSAKIISIYLKTSVIVYNKGTCDRCSLIHPPIDSILLKNISQLEGFHDLKTTRWTRISETEYWELVSRLSKHFNLFDWRLEHYWSPELD